MYAISHEKPELLKLSTGWYRPLCDITNTIHPRNVHLMDAMPMHRRIVITRSANNLIKNINHYNCVASDDNGWAYKSVVDPENVVWINASIRMFWNFGDFKFYIASPPAFAVTD